MTVLVVGNGIAGQAAALALLERGLTVEIVTRLPSSATESAARRGGFDVDDEPERHAEDLGNPLFAEVAREARTLFDRLVRLDVPFAPELARSLKASHSRTAHVGSATAYHVSRRLSARLRRFGCVPEEGLALVRLVLDDSSAVRGAILRNEKTGRIEARAASAVCLATGGYAGLFDAAHPARGRGGVLGSLFRQGAALEISGSTSLELGYDAGGVPRALPEVLFANGATLEIDSEPVAFEPRTTSFHELSLRAGTNAELVLSTADASLLGELAGTALDALARHHDTDRVRTRALPARSLGGLRVEPGEACGIPRLFAVGGASARFHREKCHAGNALLVDLWAAERFAAHVAESQFDEGEAPDLVTRTDERLAERAERAREASGESPFVLANELAALCRAGANEEALAAFSDRMHDAACPDAHLPCSPSFSLLLELEDAFLLARAVTFAANEHVFVRCTEDGVLERLDAS